MSFVWRTCFAAWVSLVNSTPHTSHFLVFRSTHFNVTLTLAHQQGVWRALHTCVIFTHVVCCLILYDSLFAFHLLSHLPFHSTDHLHLPCGGQEPCALLRMRTLASWPRSILTSLEKTSYVACGLTRSIVFREQILNSLDHHNWAVIRDEWADFQFCAVLTPCSVRSCSSWDSVYSGQANEHMWNAFLNLAAHCTSGPWFSSVYTMKNMLESRSHRIFALEIMSL